MDKILAVFQALGKFFGLIEKAWKKFREKKYQEERDALEKDPADWYRGRFGSPRGDDRMLQHGAPTEAPEAHPESRSD